MKISTSYLFDQIQSQLEELRLIIKDNEYLDHFRREEGLTGTYYPATDDWYPNFPNELVKVSMHELPFPSNEKEIWRVSVFGADDCGMNKDFSTREDAYICLKSLPVIISMQDLLERGFDWF